MRRRGKNDKKDIERRVHVEIHAALREWCMSERGDVLL